MWQLLLFVACPYARFLAIATKAIPKSRSGIEIQSVPASATLFRFRIANTAAVMTNRIPIKRRVLADKIRPPSLLLIQCLRPTANRLADERTYITPSDNAGVAISISPIEFVAM